ncbi:Cytochrome c oxidase [Cinnamomum micranthum f. kanehirae]|uniref:Cytochrome c oxidase n=1 Tax=Cinnamomum micranthum f. kanehirae TaxID=337451 RepID=A0A3S3N9X8_9MAGN|nr:Cytochrome c oxidase [Cinnamomum micranthum f. kanehirae]
MYFLETEGFTWNGPRHSFKRLRFFSAAISGKTMAFGSHQSQVSNTIRRDVLSEARNSCYKARDSFYACLDKESSKKPTEIASVGLLYPVECKKSRERFEKLCRPTWVKHFDRQHCVKKRVQRLLDTDVQRRGPISLPQPSTFMP